MPRARAKRKRGAPKGNQNARKHGFYCKVLDEAEQLDFELAQGVEGIDDEVALLRVKIKAILDRTKFKGCYHMELVDIWMKISIKKCG